METFLKQTARQILAEHPKDTDRVLVVFNNHRSELFMRRAFESLSVEVGRPFFLPQMTVIDDLVADLGGMKIVDNEFLLFELFLVHEKVGGPERKYKTFEEFMAFGDMMLSDFSEIDRYCVDARDLFVNLHGQKELDAWDVTDPNLSPFQRNYLEFYHSLYDYYTTLRANLQAKGKAYSGMAYRHVAENIATFADRCTYEKIYFVGFNALSVCEKKIIKEYSRRGIGRLVTDGDSYYFDDEMQEAGLFLRRHSKDFDEIGHFGPSLFGQGKKHMTIVECPEAVLQCKYAGQVLAEHPQWLKDSESTAVVLADEALLVPTLNALPEIDEPYKINVSMGFSFADSGVNMLVLRLLSLYRQANAKGYYHTDVIEVLSDYQIGRLIGRKNMRQIVTDKLERESRIRCQAADVASLIGTDQLNFLFPEEIPSPAGVVAILRRLAALFVEAKAFENNKKEKQSLGGLVEILNHFDELFADYASYITSLTSLERIYTRLAQRHSIAFLGKPLSGLQVLGMLETRNLDFRRVILLSANEGVLPSGRSQNTLIPYDLQRAFGLPTYREKDSVYAYNFYRLLQRAEEVYLVCSTASETMGNGEESRFLKQVRLELAPRFKGAIELDELLAGTDATLHRSDFVPEGTKTDTVMESLARHAADGFSPTALSDYVACPLSYYYKRLLGVKEPDTFDDDIDSSQFGTVIHAVMQHIYEPYLGRAVDPDGLQASLDRLPQLLVEAFDDLNKHGRSTEGRNHFLFSVGESQVRRALEREIADIKQGNTLEMVALEQNIVMPMADGVNLSGYVDRIDRYNGVLRVIDYKTGRVGDKDLAVERADLDAGKPMPAKWLQLMCYALVYSHLHPATDAILTGIFPLGNLGSGIRLATIDGSEKIFPTDLDDFRQRLTAMTAEIMNRDIPFAAPDKPAACGFCPVASFCPSKK